MLYSEDPSYSEKERALKVLELIFDYLPPAAQIEVKDLTKLINSPETEQVQLL